MPRASPAPGEVYLLPKPDEDPERRCFSARLLQALTPADGTSQKWCGCLLSDCSWGHWGEIVATEIRAFYQETGDPERVLAFAWGIQTHVSCLPGESRRNEAVGYLRERRQSKYVKGGLFAYSACILPLRVKNRSQMGLRVLTWASVWTRRASVVFDLKYRSSLWRRDPENPPAPFKSRPSAYRAEPLFPVSHEFQCWHRRGTAKWDLTTHQNHCSGDL